MSPRSPLCLLSFLALAVVAAAAPRTPIAHADTPLRITTALSTAHGRGFGAGVEMGADTTLVLGVGAAFEVGYSSVEGWVGSLDPGFGAGLRQYAGGWYMGPTVGANRRVLEQGRGFAPRGTYHFWGAFDVGHRWMQASGGAFKAGLSLGGLRTRPMGETSTFVGASLEWSWDT